MKGHGRKLPSMSAVNGIDPTSHDRLVIKIAMQHGARPPVKDSEQYANGWIGLMRAVDRFDPSRGITFSTYASWWIKAAILRPWAEAKTQGRGSGKIKTLAASQLGDADNKTPLGKDIAVDREPITIDRVVDREQREESERLVADLLRFVDERTQLFLSRWFLGDWTLEEIGEAEGITRERVRQVADRGLRKLREVAERRGITWAIPTMEIMER